MAVMPRSDGASPKRFDYSEPNSEGMSGFLGKTLVASAGVTVMAAFPKDKRWLTRDAALLIHGRRIVKDLHLVDRI